MKVYVMSVNYGDGTAGVKFYREKISIEDDSIDLEYMGPGIDDGTWLTFPDDFDFVAAGIKFSD